MPSPNKFRLKTTGLQTSILTGVKLLWKIILLGLWKTPFFEGFLIGSIYFAHELIVILSAREKNRIVLKIVIYRVVDTRELTNHACLLVITSLTVYRSTRWTSLHIYQTLSIRMLDLVISLKRNNILDGYPALLFVKL